MTYKTNTDIQGGFTLVEVMLGVLIIAVVNVSVYALINFTLKVSWETRAKTGATVIANQYMESAHNLPFNSIGVVGGIPAGTLPQTATTTLNTIPFTIRTTVVYVDDPFDGTLGGTPADLLPTDYKRLRIEVSWPFRLNTQPVVFISDIAPKGLETSAGGGTLRITIINASGVPVPQANVHIENNSVNPAINFDIVSDNTGQVLLPGASPSVETYLVSATKSGYSTDQTYLPDPINLPNPARPPLSVFEGQVTNATFSIDRVSTITTKTVTAQDTACSIVLNAPWPHDTATYHIAHVAASTTAADLYVAGDTGDDTTGDGSQTLPYRTINRALQDISSSHGHTIHVKGEITYAEEVALTNAHSGSSTSSTVIQAWGTTGQPRVAGSAYGFRLTDADWVTLTGFKVASTTGAGVLLDSGSSNVTIRNLDIAASGGRGILVRNGSDRATIINNRMYQNTSDGIKVEQSSQNVLIQNNTLFLNGGTGIFFDSITNPVVTNTIIASSTTDAIRTQLTSGIISDYNLMIGNASTTVGFIEGGHSLYVDPLFVNTLGGNFHLKSIAGYYPYGSGNVATQHSPAIDSGRPSDAYSSEPIPNGCRVNIGAYGSTAEASLSMTAGTPIPSIPFTMVGTKTVGTNAGGQPVYKFNQSFTTDTGGQQIIANVEWDTYSFTISPTTTGYDIAHVTPPDPVTILPNTTPTITFGLWPDTAQTLRTMVVDTSNQPLSGASVRVFNTGLGYDKTITTPANGQVFFPSLAIASYSLTITKSGYNTVNDSVSVSGDAVKRATMTGSGSPPPPPSPPAPPIITGFSTVTSTTMTLSWIDNATNEDGYRLYRNTVNIKPGTPLATVPSNTLSYIGNGLMCGTTYYWWVEAYNAQGTAEDSDSQSTNACLQPPAAPTNLTFGNITQTSMNLSWTDNATNEDEYRIYRNTSSTKPGTPLATLSSNTTSYPATGLTCGTTYWWWVEAFNTAGMSEISSSQITGACGPTLVFSDTFTESTTRELSLHTPDLGSGWAKLFGVPSGSQLGVIASSDQLQDNGWCSSSQGALYQTSTVLSGANYEVTVAQINGDTGDDYNVIAARIQDANNMYAFKWNESDGRLYKRESGTWSTLGSATPGVLDGSTIMLKVNGSTITVKDDTVTLVSLTDTSLSLPGRAGVGIGAIITGSDDCSSQSLDNFQVNVTN